MDNKGYIISDKLTVRELLKFIGDNKIDLDSFVGITYENVAGDAKYVEFDEHTNTLFIGED